MASRCCSRTWLTVTLVPLGGMSNTSTSPEDVPAGGMAEAWVGAGSPVPEPLPLLVLQLGSLHPQTRWPHRAAPRRCPRSAGSRFCESPDRPQPLQPTPRGHSVPGPSDVPPAPPPAVLPQTPVCSPTQMKRPPAAAIPRANTACAERKPRAGHGPRQLRGARRSALRHRGTRWSFVLGRVP